MVAVDVAAGKVDPGGASLVNILRQEVVNGEGTVSRREVVGSLAVSRDAQYRVWHARMIIQSL